MKIFATLVVLAGLMIVPTVFAEETKTSKQCAEAFDQCQQTCNENNPGDSATKAACLARCSADYAACDAAAAYDKAKPWLERQADKAKKFWDELTKPTPKIPSKDSKDKSI